MQCSIGNGATAIFAGVFAQFLEDALGQIGPFQGAIALTTLALALILRWEENYGEAQGGGHENSSLYRQFTDGWKLVAGDSRVLRIGLIQALSEGGMYTVSFYENVCVSILLSQTRLVLVLEALYLTTLHSIPLFYKYVYATIKVCLHVGPYSLIDEPSRRCADRLRFFGTDDGYYNWRHCIPTIRTLLCNQSHNQS